MKTIIYNLDEIETLLIDFNNDIHLSKIEKIINSCTINKINIDYIYNQKYFGVEIIYDNDYKLTTQIEFKETDCIRINDIITKANKISITEIKQY